MPSKNFCFYVAGYEWQYVSHGQIFMLAYQKTKAVFSI